jgi:hypothetical protein
VQILCWDAQHAGAIFTASNRTEEGKPLVLNVVRKAEQKIINNPSENKVHTRISPTQRALIHSKQSKVDFQCEQVVLVPRLSKPLCIWTLSVAVTNGPCRAASGMSSQRIIRGSPVLCLALYATQDFVQTDAVLADLLHSGGRETQGCPCPCFCRSTWASLGTQSSTS